MRICGSQLLAGPGSLYLAWSCIYIFFPLTLIKRFYSDSWHSYSQIDCFWKQSETEQLTQAISIMVFSFSQGNANFKQGQIDERAKLRSAVESHSEEITQMEIIQSIFQLYTWLWLQPQHGSPELKEWTDTSNKFNQHKIKNKVNPGSCNFCSGWVDVMILSKSSLSIWPFLFAFLPDCGFWSFSWWLTVWSLWWWCKIRI